MKRMRIEGMTCEGCNEAVAEALMGGGAVKVRADFKKGEATFEPGEASEAPDRTVAPATAVLRSAVLLSRRMLRPYLVGTAY